MAIGEAEAPTPGVPSLPLGDALAALDNGAPEVAIRGRESVLVRAAGRSRARSEGCLLRGWATTDDSPGAVDAGLLQPARAIRRALADGQMKAAEIGYACIAAPAGIDAAQRDAVIRRAFSDHAAHIVTEYAADALSACIGALQAGGTEAAVAVYLRLEGRTVALALRAPA